MRQNANEEFFNGLVKAVAKDTQFAQGVRHHLPVDEIARAAVSAVLAEVGLHAIVETVRAVGLAGEDL